MQFPDSITFGSASPVGMIRGRVANVKEPLPVTVMIGGSLTFRYRLLLLTFEKSDVFVRATGVNCIFEGQSHRPRFNGTM